MRSLPSWVDEGADVPSVLAEGLSVSETDHQLNMGGSAGEKSFSVGQHQM